MASGKDSSASTSASCILILAVLSSLYCYTLFHLFINSTVAMVFGQGDSKKSVYILNTIVGIIGFVICIFNCFVVCKHPAFQKGGEFYTDPNVFVLISYYM